MITHSLKGSCRVLSLDEQVLSCSILIRLTFGRRRTSPRLKVMKLHTCGMLTLTLKHCFAAVTALEWLCDFTSVIGREEAAEMAAQFVRFGLITLVSDKRKNNDSAIIFTVRGAAGGANSTISVCVHCRLLSIMP